jgi:hypothetical protein
VIVPVDTHIVNMQHLLQCHGDTPPIAATGVATDASNGGSAGQSSNNIHAQDSAHRSSFRSTANPGGAGLTASGSRVNFAHGTAIGGEGSAFSVSPGTSYGMTYCRGFGESKSNLSQLEDALAPLRAQIPPDLSPQEVSLLERLFPFVLNTTVSAKTVGEIAWVLRVQEEEILHVIGLVPFLHTVKKVSA